MKIMLGIVMVICNDIGNMMLIYCEAFLGKRSNKSVCFYKYRDVRAFSIMYMCILTYQTYQTQFQLNHLNFNQTHQTMQPPFKLSEIVFFF